MRATAGTGDRRTASPAQVPAARAPGLLGVTLVVLALYTGFGKGFAYAGYPPFFVGEILLLALCAAVLDPAARVPHHAAAALTAALVGASAVQAVSDLARGADPLETARGLAPIYYAGYAFGVFALLRRLESRAGRADALAMVDRALVRATPGVVAALALLAMLLAVRPEGVVTWPGSGVRMFFSKAGDIAVGLALTGAVLARRRTAPLRFAGALTALWAVAAVLVVFRSRGALLSLAIGAFAMRPRPERVVKGLAAGLAVFVLLYASGISIRVESDREVSARSAIESLASLAGGTEEDAAGSNYVATREWRSDWWGAIWQDVEANAMVLHGTGWGDNLAVRYGVVDPSRALDPLVLRLPHNAFFSLAGRAGVAVAAGFLLVPLVTLARSYRDRRPPAARERTSLATEMARAGIAAALVTAMADVYLESPQGGILLWALLGLLWWAQARPLDGRHEPPASPEPR